MATFDGDLRSQEAPMEVRRPRSRRTRLRMCPRNKFQQGRPSQVDFLRQQQQDWLNKRLEGMCPDDFGAIKQDRICFCTPEHLTAPAKFESHWAHYADIDAAEGGIAALPAAVREAKHLVIFVDVADSTAASEILRFLRPLADLGMDMPLTYVAPHTTELEALGREVVGMDTGFVQLALKNGIDGAIAGQPVGFSLALALRSQFQQSAMLCEAFNNNLHRRKVNAWKAMQTMRSSHYLMWEYPRVRNHFMIPAMKVSLGHGQPHRIDGFSVGRRLLTGENGMIFTLKRRARDREERHDEHDERVEVALNAVAAEVATEEELPAGVVDGDNDAGADAHGGVDDTTALSTVEQREQDHGTLIAYEKKQFRSLRDLRVVKMHQLLGSKQWSHSNLMRLLAVHQSQSHLLFRFDGGGSETLYRRMLARGEKPLSCSKAFSIITQALDVVTFLHTGPSVAHLNIKPENFTVTEEEGNEDSLALKLVGFDLSVAQPDGSLCQRCKGCVPFVAPEVLEMRPYCGFAADVWSVGILIVEVLCGVHTIERHLGWRREKASQPNGPRSIALQIKAAFKSSGAVANMLDEHCREELRPLLPIVAPLLDGILRTNVAERWKSKSIAEYLASSLMPQVDSQR